jgi:hypothetical protein
MMIGQRAFAKPTHPSVKVQRADGAYGQFLPAQGQEVIVDEFLLRRAAEGSVTITAIEQTSKQAEESDNG